MDCSTAAPECQRIKGRQWIPSWNMHQWQWNKDQRQAVFVWRAGWRAGWNRLCNHTILPLLFLFTYTPAVDGGALRLWSARGGVSRLTLQMWTWRRLGLPARSMWIFISLSLRLKLWSLCSGKWKAEILNHIELLSWELLRNIKLDTWKEGWHSDRSGSHHLSLTIPPIMSKFKCFYFILFFLLFQCSICQLDRWKKGLQYVLKPASRGSAKSFACILIHLRMATTCFSEILFFFATSPQHSASSAS